MKIKFLTFGLGHLVSDKEFDRLQKGFSKVGMELIRDGDEYDILMVKGFSHTWEQIPHDRPIVMYSIGSEWKVGVTPELNEPIRELYQMANATIHVSESCKESMRAVFPNLDRRGQKEYVIIPADEPKLPEKYIEKDFMGHGTHGTKYVPGVWAEGQKLKLATTCIPRPVKRSDQLEELTKKYDIDLVPAWGSVSDFSYYHDCDGYIHLSRKEGMPNTVLEALAYGLPCIVTNYGGAKEAVGEAGIIIRNDPEGVAWDPSNILPVDEILFANAIEEFKRRLPELRIKVRERVLSELNDYVAACKFKEVFESLL